MKNRAALAQRERTSANRVLQVLNLLRLESRIQAWILTLPPGTPERYVTERKLRGIAKMERKEQLEAVRQRWGPGSLTS